MKFSILLIVLFACPIVFSQSRDELTKRYGKPVSETFLVRPGIGVTATYSPGGQIVELVIAPHTNDMWKSRNDILDRKLTDEILAEVVPLSERGKFLIGTFLHVICLPENDCEGTSSSYENLEIYYNSGRNGGLAYAVVRWK